MPAKGIAKNTTYFTAALILQKSISFVYFYFLSSQIAPSLLGKYVFALSYTSLFSIFIDLGIAPILIRQASRKPENSQAYIQNIVGVKIPLSLLVTFIAIFIIQFSGKGEETKYLVYLASVIMALDAFTINFWGIFRSHQNMLYESLATIFVQCIIFIFGVSALYLTHNIVYIMLALVIASIFNFVYSAILLKIKLGCKIFPRWEREVIMQFARLIPMFALSGIFSKIYNSVDTVILGFISSESAVGYYSIPAKIITSLSQIIPASFAAALFPVYSQYYIQSKDALKEVFIGSFRYLIFFSFPMALGMFLLFPKVLATVWPVYVPVTATAQIMSFSLPFIFLSFSTGYFLNACENQKYNTMNRGIMAACTIIFNLILIPKFGTLGAGGVFVFVNMLVFALDMLRVTKIMALRLKDFSEILTKSSFASIIMVGGILLAMQRFHFILAAIFGGTLYFASAWKVKLISLDMIKKYFRI